MERYIGPSDIDSLEEEYKGNTVVRDRSVIYWLEMSKVEERIYDHRYGELDDFLSNSQILKATVKPLFKSLIEGLSQRWNQLFDRLDKRLCRNILATQSPTAQRYNTP